MDKELTYNILVRFKRFYYDCLDNVVPGISIRDITCSFFGQYFEGVGYAFPVALYELIFHVYLTHYLDVSWVSDKESDSN